MLAHVEKANTMAAPHQSACRARWPCWANALAPGVFLCSGAIVPGVVYAAPLPDTFLARLEALASMETLNAELLASRSATATLETWCADHDLGGKITALVVPGVEKPPHDEQRRTLDVGPSELVRYRRVKLACGSHVLSEADNWYVPSRLTPDMNRLLETTDTPFGKAVAALTPTRRTLAVAMLWQPLKPGWERRQPSADHPGDTLEIPLILFEHRAVLSDAKQRPFSEVEEHYTREILSFADPHR